MEDGSMPLEARKIFQRGNLESLQQSAVRAP